MNPFGDGSDGALNVLSGTTNLLLNHKYQFSTVNIASGAAVSTNSTTGAVLYILATQSITINGAINVSSKVNPGNNTWSWTVDGVTYTSPGVANGGEGANNGGSSGFQNSGFGGGGATGSIGSAVEGLGGNGSSVPGIGGASVSKTVGTNSSGYTSGTNGGGSAGGGGGAYASLNTTGTVTGSTYSGTSGAGGNAYGADGQDAGVGSVSVTPGTGGGTYSYSMAAIGGGGAGGIAGRSGVHVVLKAPTIIINGQIVTTGSNGGKGGNGGRNRINNVLSSTRNGGGGGGGGGKGGNVSVFFTSSYSGVPTLTLAGGSGGAGGNDSGTTGTSGAAGAFTSTQLAPFVDFTADVTSGDGPLTVHFTNTTPGADSIEWDFGDGNTSVLENPTYTYDEIGQFTVSLTGTNEIGETTETKTDFIDVLIPVFEVDFLTTENGGNTVVITSEEGTFSIASGGLTNSALFIKTTYQALPQKEYEYRVFDESGNYIGTWENVLSEFSYTQKINETASELNVAIGRNPDNRLIKLAPLQDNDSEPIVDDNSDPIYVQTETANSIGEGTDVRENLNVDVFAFYGGYETIADEDGDEILDNNLDPILSQYGAPNGKRVYSGYIVDYELVYGKQTGVNVIVVPHATEMNHYIFKNSDGDTTVSYSDEDPVQMAKDAMSNYNAQGGRVTFSVESMPLSGEPTDYDFKLQTTKEVQDKTIELLPSGFYHYPDPGDNTQYILQKSETPHHTFYYEKHISELHLRKSITQLINKVYFMGGETSPGVNLYKYYEDLTSIENIRPGLERISDTRVKLESSASILSNRDIEEFKTARWRTSVTITDVVYDIETIKLGQMVAFKNFGTFADSLVLQIVNIERAKHNVKIDLDMSLPGEAKRLQEQKRAIMNELVRNIGDTPA